MGITEAGAFAINVNNTVNMLSKSYISLIDKSFIVVLPFPNHYRHEKNWNADEVKEYKSVLKRADETITLLKEYKSGSYFKRNRFLVDNASLCIAYHRRNGSGTAYTVNYAEMSKIQVINLANEEK